MQALMSGGIDAPRHVVCSIAGQIIGVCCLPAPVSEIGFFRGSVIERAERQKGNVAMESCSKVSCFLRMIFCCALMNTCLSMVAHAQMYHNYAATMSRGSHLAVASSALRLESYMDSFTIECWINPLDNIDTMKIYLITKESGGDLQKGFVLRLDSGYVKILTNDTVRLRSSRKISSNWWTHVAATLDSATKTFMIYTNGYPYDTSVVPNVYAYPILLGADSLFIGRPPNLPWGSGWGFLGMIDNIRIWRRCLTHSEITLNLHSSLCTPEPYSGGAYDALILSLPFQSPIVQTGFDLRDYSSGWYPWVNPNYERYAVSSGAEGVDLSNRPSPYNIFNESIHLDGVDDYAAADGSCCWPSQQITVEAWIYPLTNSPATILSKGYSSSFSFRMYLTSLNELGVGVNGHTSVVSYLYGTIPLSQWTHVAITYGPSSIPPYYILSAYINGTHAPGGGSVDWGALTSNTDSLLIGGGRAELPSFYGLIDEVRLFDYVKTEEEINSFLYRSIDQSDKPPGGHMNIVYNCDGNPFSCYPTSSTPPLYLRGHARYSDGWNAGNFPSPLDRADDLHFSDGYYIKQSSLSIPPKPPPLGLKLTEDSLRIEDNEVINDLNLFVALQYILTPDLTIALISPQGDSIAVCANSYHAGDRAIVTIFDDQTDSLMVNSGRYTSASPRIRPLNALNTALAGRNCRGTWKLKVITLCGFPNCPFYGVLHAWGLQINNHSSLPVHVLLSVKAFLEGPYSAGSMSTALNAAGVIPLAQPYSGAPWNYTGTESVSYIPSNVVDWVLVELRTGNPASPPMTKVATRAAFLKSDGTVVDIDGTSPISFGGVGKGSYYIVIRHRNQLAIMSAGTVALSSTSVQYDFTTAMTQAYGTNPMKLVSTKYVMYAGDGNGDGVINATDRNLVWRVQNGTVGYLTGDFNLDGVANATDRNLYWRINNGKSGSVPARRVQGPPRVESTHAIDTGRKANVK